MVKKLPVKNELKKTAECKRITMEKNCMEMHKNMDTASCVSSIIVVVNI